MRIPSRHGQLYRHGSDVTSPHLAAGQVPRSPTEPHFLRPRAQGSHTSCLLTVLRCRRGPNRAVLHRSERQRTKAATLLLAAAALPRALPQAAKRRSRGYATVRT